MPTQSEFDAEKHKYILYRILQMQAAAEAAKSCIQSRQFFKQLEVKT